MAITESELAIYKPSERIRVSNSQVFDYAWPPGAEARYDGIYQCAGCGLEKAIAGGRLLPGASQLKHPRWCSKVQWTLLVSVSEASPPGEPSSPPDE